MVVSVLCGVLVLALFGSSASATEVVLWAKRYNGPGNGSDLATALKLSPDGSKVFVTGRSRGSGTGDDFATQAYNAATGAALWTKRYNGPGNGNDDAVAMALSPSGATVYVTGVSAGSSTTGNDYATQAYGASTGQVLWTVRYNDSTNGNDVPAAVDVSPDGSKVFVTGSAEPTQGGADYNYATQAYNASTGAVVWTKQFTSGGALDKATALAVSADSSKVFVTGFSPEGNQTGYDYLTLAYDAATGTVVWKKVYVGPTGDDLPTAIGVSNDGSKVFVTGSSPSMSGGDDYATVAYNATTGAQLWTKRYNGPGNSDDEPAALAVSADGSKVFVTGRSKNLAGDFDMATQAYNASTGAALWTMRYNPSSATDVALALAVSGDGSTVVVTGASNGNYATLAYNTATGAQLWTKIYAGPESTDGASAVAVNSDASKVFVTGQSLGATSGYDYATIAYSAS